MSVQEVVDFAVQVNDGLFDGTDVAMHNPWAPWDPIDSEEFHAAYKSLFQTAFPNEENPAAWFKHLRAYVDIYRDTHKAIPMTCDTCGKNSLNIVCAECRAIERMNSSLVCTNGEG